MSACAQLIIAFLLILLQLGIIVALFLMEPPKVRFVQVENISVEFVFQYKCVTICQILF